MGNPTLQERLALASEYLKNQLVINAPKDTWNMALNSIRLVQIEPNYWKIIIGGEIAPYAIFTNEEWINRKGKNPNEHWVEYTIDQCTPYIKALMSEPIDMNEYKSIINGQHEALKTQQDIRIAELDRALNEMREGNNNG